MPQNDLGEELKAACDDVVQDPALQPEYDKTGKLLRTFCNFGARRVAEALGCLELDNPEENADVMHDLMEANASGRWKKATGLEAAAHALGGGLSFAVMRSTQLKEKHGHICAVRPEATQHSESLNLDVPMVANVGKGNPSSPLAPAGRDGILTKKNWSCKVSQAFPVADGEPEYFTWG